MFRVEPGMGSTIRNMAKMVPWFAGQSVVLIVLACFTASAICAEDRIEDRETDPKVLARLEEYRDWESGLIISWWRSCIPGVEPRPAMVFGW